MIKKTKNSVLYMICHGNSEYQMEERLKEAVLYSLFCSYLEKDVESFSISEFRKLFKEGLSLDHYGDCTKQSCPCIRCAYVGVKDEADLVIKMFMEEE